MEIVILASGSKGNAISITSNGSKILIDIGISYRNLVKKLNEEDISLKQIENVLITHEHSDHIKGLKVFAKNNSHVKYHLSRGTYDALDLETQQLISNHQIISDKDIFNINQVKVSVFSLSHDATEPIGFVLERENKKMVLATDTGYIDEAYFNLLSNADLYILEANHEPSLLMDSGRPYHLKQRIISETGHLSNNEASWLINHFIKDKEESIWAVAHISEDCNTTYSIEKSIVNIVEDPTKLKVLYTSQDSTEKIILWWK